MGGRVDRAMRPAPPTHSPCLIAAKVGVSVSAKRIKHVVVKDDAILIRDFKTDAHIKYPRCVLTRGRKRAVRALYHEIDEVRRKLSEIENPSLDQENEAEDSVVRFYGDMVNILLDGDDKSVAPGDLLYAQWEADEIDEDEIYKARDGAVSDDQDPT